MNTKNLPSLLLFFCLALSGCSPPQPGATRPGQAPVISSPAASGGAAAATRTPRPTATTIPTATSMPTPTFTATPDAAIYDPSTFGDIRKLDSFVLTEIWKQTAQGYLNENENKSEYNRSQAAFHQTYKYHGFDAYLPDTTTSSEHYWLGEWVYNRDNLTSLWGASKPSKELNNRFPLDDFDLSRRFSFDYFKSATYLGIEQYYGIPAYHYSMDETNMIELKKWKVSKAVGDLFISVEGRYPLHYNARYSGKVIIVSGQDPPLIEGVVENTMNLVSFNQPVQISLPADYPNFDLNLDFPLPSGSVLGGVGKDASGGIHYTYVTPVNEEEFKAFYASLDAARGWSALEPTDVHYGDFWCTACPIFSKDGQKVAVDFFDDTRFTQHIADYIYVNFLPPR
jgi:hypothetical protein